MSMKNHKMNLRPIVGAMIMALAAPVAMAAVTPPAANVLPGAFYTNQSATTYASSGASSAVITVSSGATVLQFGGSSAGVSSTIAAPSGITTAAGFNIGASAALTVAAASTGASVLVNDITGNPSQIYGTLSAGASSPTLFVANANGVIVGNSATITLPGGGGFIAEAQNPANFTATAGLVQTGTGSGDVTLMSNAAINNGGYLLVAGNGNVNVGDVATTTGSGVTIMAGYGFTQTGNTAASAAAGALPTTTATVNFSGGVSGTSSTPNATLYAAGNVNVLGGSYVSLGSVTFSGLGGSFTNNGTATIGSLAPSAAFINNGLLDATSTVTAGTTFTNNGTITSIGAITAGGAFTNNGTVQTGGIVNAASITNAGSFTASGINFTAASTGGIVNSGTLNASGGTVALLANSTAGTLISNTGTISDMTSLGATAASGHFTNTGTLNYSTTGGSLGVSATNGSVTLGGNVQIASSALSATNSLGTVNLSAGSAGTLQLGTMLFAGSSATLSGGAVTVTSGGFSGSGTGTTLAVDVGSGYNLGLYAGTQLTAPTVNVNGSGANLILAGTLGGTNASTITVMAANIYAGAHTAGGFSLSPSGALNLTFSGNIVNQNGVTSPVLNYAKAMPVNANGGYVKVSLDPTNAGTAKQYVNLGVNGSAILESTISSPVTIGSANGSIIPNYPWGGLTVQATGNLQAGSSAGSFYYPGQMFFATVNSLGGTFGLSKSGTIYVSGQLSNAVTSNLTGMGGMAFLTNNALVFGNGTTKGIDGATMVAGNVLTNTNAWLNFPGSGSLATGYNALNAQNKYFYGLVYANGTFTPTLAGGTNTTNKFNSVTLP